jgi:hypothetical protein
LLTACLRSACSEIFFWIAFGSNCAGAIGPMIP